MKREVRGTRFRVTFEPGDGAWMPKPLDESESSLKSDLEFVLPDDIPADAVRIPAQEFDGQPSTSWGFEYADGEISQVFGTLVLRPDGVLICRHVDGHTHEHSRHPGATADEVEAWLTSRGYELRGNGATRYDDATGNLIR